MAAPAHLSPVLAVEPVRPRRRPAPKGDWVEAAPFRAHLLLLMASGGLSAAEVATMAGLPPQSVVRLAQGRPDGRPVRRLSRFAGRALLRLAPEDGERLRATPVPAAASRRRLRRLLAEGATPPQLATLLGVGVADLVALADEDAEWCPGLLALRLLVRARGRGVRPATDAVAA